MIHKALLSTFFFLFFFSWHVSLMPLDTQDKIIEIKTTTKNSAEQNKKVKLLLAYQPEEDPGYQALIKHLEAALSWSGHLAVTSKKKGRPQTKQEILELVQEGYPLVLFIQYDPSDTSVEWRLYDAINADMVKGKKHKKMGKLDAESANALAQELWPELLQEPGFFKTKLAYIRRLSQGLKYRSHICLTNYDGTHEKIIYDKPTIYAELSFHPSIQAPRLLTSEFTFDGIQLIMLDFHGNRRSILGGDKAIIGASLSDCADTVLYTESGNIWRYTHGKKKGSSEHELLVCRPEKCSSARLCTDSKDCIYCSDNTIYRYKNSDKKIVTVIDNGIAPDYSAAKKAILFSRKINDSLQLFLLHELKEKPQQLTFDGGNKTDARFSPCGNYIVYCH